MFIYLNLCLLCRVLFLIFYFFFFYLFCGVKSIRVGVLL